MQTIRWSFFIAADGLKNCQGVGEMEKISGRVGKNVRAEGSRGAGEAGESGGREAGRAGRAGVEIFNWSGEEYRAGDRTGLTDTQAGG